MGIGRNNTARAVVWNSRDWVLSLADAPHFAKAEPGLPVINSLWFAAGPWRKFSYRLGVLANSAFDNATVLANLAAGSVRARGARARARPRRAARERAVWPTRAAAACPRKVNAAPRFGTALVHDPHPPTCATPRPPRLSGTGPP